MKTHFDHENLKVYQMTLKFNAWVGDLLEESTKRAAVKEQLDRAATSVALNIAEGNGKFSRKDRARYFDIARGSSVESASCLDVMVSRKLADSARIHSGKAMLLEVVSMLMGLLKGLGYFGEDEVVRLKEMPDESNFAEPKNGIAVTYRSKSKSKSKK